MYTDGRECFAFYLRECRGYYELWRERRDGSPPVFGEREVYYISYIKEVLLRQLTRFRRVE